MFRKNEETEIKDPVVEKTEAVEAQVNEVKAVMDENIQAMMERGEKLEDLEHKTGMKIYIKCNMKYLCADIL